MAKKEANYFMVIPAIVWNANISPNAKLLFGHISVLTSAEGYAYASNKYYADALNSKIPSIKKWMNQLEELGAIRRDIERENTGEFKSRKIYITCSLLKTQEPSISKDTPSISQDTTLVSQETPASIPQDMYINTSNTNINNNTNGDDDIKGKIFFKLVDNYPKNRIGNRQHGLKAFKKLSIEECKIALKNVKRYLEAAGGYNKSLINYIREECYTDQWLNAQESLNKTRKSSIKSNDTKTFKGNYDDIS